MPAIAHRATAGRLLEGSKETNAIQSPRFSIQALYVLTLKKMEKIVPMRTPLVLLTLQALTTIATLQGGDTTPLSPRQKWLSKTLNVSPSLSVTLDNTTTLLQETSPCPQAAQLLLTRMNADPVNENEEAKTLILHRSSELKAIIQAKKPTTPSN